MTIADTSRRAGPYTITPGASYPFGFVVFDTDEVTVTIADADGNESELDPSLFTVTLTETGGSVDLDESVTGEKIVITSAVPMTQETIITNKGGFYPDVLNKAHDKLTALVQQLDEKIDRSIKVPVSSSATADEYKSEIEAIANEAAASAASASIAASGAESAAISAQSMAGDALVNSQEALQRAGESETVSGAALSTANNAVTTASNATTLANDAVTAAMQAKTQAQTASSNASTAITRADAASASAQSSHQAVQTIQANLPSDIEEEVSRQIGSELQTTVEGIVRQVAPEIIEETAASKDYVDTAVSAEASARSAADTALGQRIDNIGDNLADVATSGSYNDLTDKPTIPTVPSNVSAFTNDANYTSKTYVDEAIAGVDALPDQTGQSGKVLGTDGTSASWVSPPSGRNIGEIVQSAIPLTDAGLHLLDGSLLPSGGVYAQFVQHINGLQASYPSLFCTQAEFDASVSAYGSCGKFVVSASGVRLPKVSDILQGTTDLSAVGDLVEAGLPNITAGFTLHGSGSANIINSLVGNAVGGAGGDASAYRTPSDLSQKNGAGSLGTFDINASSASPYYKDSVTKPTPQTIKSLLYICVATSVKTPVEVDIDEIATDLNGKLDKNPSEIVLGGLVLKKSNDNNGLVYDGLGCIAEEGSGADWFRFSNGIQICFMRKATSFTPNVDIRFDFSYPVPFISLPTVEITLKAGWSGYIRIGYEDESTASCSGYFKNLGGSGDGFVNLIAIGRWK